MEALSFRKKTHHILCELVTSIGSINTGMIHIYFKHLQFLGKSLTVGTVLV